MVCPVLVVCVHVALISQQQQFGICVGTASRERVKLVEWRCEILMVSLCVHHKSIHYSSHLEGRIAALSCRVLPTHVFALSRLLETLCSSADIWLCPGFGHSHAATFHFWLIFSFWKRVNSGPSGNDGCCRRFMDPWNQGWLLDSWP